MGGPAASTSGPISGPDRYRSERHSQVAAVSQVAHGGDACAEGGLGVAVHPGEKRGVVIGEHLFDRITGRVEHQMLMRVHQAGQQGDVAEVDDVGLGGWHRPGEVDVRDPPALDEHGRAAAAHGETVEQARSADGRDPPVTCHGRRRRTPHGTICRWKPGTVHPPGCGWCGPVGLAAHKATISLRCGRCTLTPCDGLTGFRRPPNGDGAWAGRPPAGPGAGGHRQLDLAHLHLPGPVQSRPALGHCKNRARSQRKAPDPNPSRARRLATVRRAIG